MKLILNAIELKALVTILQHEPSDGCEITILAGDDRKAGIQIEIGDLAAAIALKSPAREK